MKTTKNTILITGGSAGIGFETAKLLSAQGNHVIIIGRDQKRLDEAKSKLPNVTAIKADVSKAEDVKELVSTIARLYPELNVVINNAGKAVVHHLNAETQNGFTIAEDEILINYLSIVRLNEQLLPLLRQQSEAAIVNVSSVVAYVPAISLPTYSATKAALHSYTKSLRLSLTNTNVKVFELMPPLVDTELSASIGGHNGIHPSVVANGLLAAFENDEFEIRVGDTAKIYELYLSSPSDALTAMNPASLELTH